ncbi:MAG: plasmid stabilization system protein [Chthonomonadales bacterium]|nr:plasmid stabilization system protein [Chthonomonadales bacterium]
MPDEYKIILQPEAMEDIETAYNYIGRQKSIEAAHTWARGLMDAINSLGIMPHRCPLARENPVFPYEIRQLLYGKGSRTYRIIFTIQEDTVSILHIRSSAQDDLKPEQEY